MKHPVISMFWQVFLISMGNTQCHTGQYTQKQPGYAWKLTCPFLIQIHPTAAGTTARFLCPVHQSKLFCRFSPVCSRQMVILRRCCISESTPAEQSQQGTSLAGAEPGLPSQPPGCSLCQGCTCSESKSSKAHAVHQTHFLQLQK